MSREASVLLHTVFCFLFFRHINDCFSFVLNIRSLCRSTFYNKTHTRAPFLHRLHLKVFNRKMAFVCMCVCVFFVLFSSLFWTFLKHRLLCAIGGEYELSASIYFRCNNIVRMILLSRAHFGYLYIICRFSIERLIKQYNDIVNEAQAHNSYAPITGADNSWYRSIHHWKLLRFKRFLVVGPDIVSILLRTPFQSMCIFCEMSKTSKTWATREVDASIGIEAHITSILLLMQF